MTIDPVELERLIEIAGKMPISSYPGKSYDERSRNAVTMVDTLIDLRKSLRTGQLVPAQPSNRIIYNLQKGGDRLCDALRTIAAGCDDAKGVAKAALNHKAPWLEPPAMPSGDVVKAVARKFSLGDRVTKTKGSSWTGLVVGFYSTSLTPIGYAVESENEPGSVQIYPESALASDPLLDRQGNGKEG